MTALQTLIIQLHKKLDAFPDDMNLSQRGLYDGYLNALKMATLLFETEKKQIIDARENGRQAEYEHHFINDDNNISSNQYYNQLIKKENERDFRK